MKVLGKRSAGKPHAAFDEAGAGNGKLEFTAPVFDPTCEKLRGKILWLTRSLILINAICERQSTQMEPNKIGAFNNIQPL